MFKALRLCPPGDYNDDNIVGENTEEEEAWGWLGQKQGSQQQPGYSRLQVLTAHGN